MRMCIISGTTQMIERAQILVDQIITESMQRSMGGGVGRPRDDARERAASTPGAVKISHTVPGHRAGVVIGRGGETIREIQGMTGTHIELDRSTPQSAPERMFFITGTPDQIEAAKRMIDERVAAAEMRQSRGPPPFRTGANAYPAYPGGGGGGGYPGAYGGGYPGYPQAGAYGGYPGYGAYPGYGQPGAPQSGQPQAAPAGGIGALAAQVPQPAAAYHQPQHQQQTSEAPASSADSSSASAGGAPAPGYPTHEQYLAHKVCKEEVLRQHTRRLTLSSPLLPLPPSPSPHPRFNQHPQEWYNSQGYYGVVPDAAQTAGASADPQAAASSASGAADTPASSTAAATSAATASAPAASEAQPDYSAQWAAYYAAQAQQMQGGQSQGGAQ